MKISILILFVGFVLPALTVARSNDLPIPGKWKGIQRCMEMSAGEVNEEMNRELTLIIRGDEIFNEYRPPTPPESNSMFAFLDPKAGFTSDDPELIRSMVGVKVFSKNGNEMLSRLADVLTTKPTSITTYTFKPNKDVVKGKMFCDPKESWCHFQATKRVPFEGKIYEVEGSDMMKVVGDNLVRVGYAIDKFGCAPKTCTYVCEAQLKAIP